MSLLSTEKPKKKIIIFYSLNIEIIKCSQNFTTVYYTHRPNDNLRVQNVQEKKDHCSMFMVMDAWQIMQNRDFCNPKTMYLRTATNQVHYIGQTWLIFLLFW